MFEDRACVGLWGEVEGGEGGARSPPTLHQREVETQSTFLQRRVMKAARQLIQTILTM